MSVGIILIPEVEGNTLSLYYHTESLYQLIFWLSTKLNQQRALRSTTYCQEQNVLCIDVLCTHQLPHALHT